MYFSYLFKISYSTRLYEQHLFYESIFHLCLSLVRVFHDRIHLDSMLRYSKYCTMQMHACTIRIFQELAILGADIDF